MSRRRRQFRLFPPLRRQDVFTSKPREENVPVHTVTVPKVDNGNHAPLPHEDESQANPGDVAQTEDTSSDIEMRVVGPDRNRVQDPMQVCPNSTFSCVRAYIQTPCNRVRLLHLPLPRRRDACR